MVRQFINIKPFLFLFKFLLMRTCNRIIHFQRKTSTFNNKQSFTGSKMELLSTQTVMFHVEGALLKSSSSTSIFPYFMLVAFEAGSPIRALVLLLLYPFVSLVGKEFGLKIMVLVSFVGIKVDSLRIGHTVLPKFFLEDVGFEGFNMVMKSRGRKIAVSDMPRVMVDGFLRYYLGIDHVVGRELKVAGGYFLGLMEPKKRNNVAFNQILGEGKVEAEVIGLGCLNKSLDQEFFSLCKTVYLTTEHEKKTWKVLPREKYAKPLIFHDGRLAFKPMPIATLAMFMWIPFGFVLFVIRCTLGILLPYKLSVPILSISGMNGTLAEAASSNPETNSRKSRGTLYVCNHRTLFDPIFASTAVMKPLAAVTYSLSKLSELLAPIKTVRLTRDRGKDSALIQKLLSQGDLVICPEGTTCREPYLLRFSPLFAELSEETIPMAIDIRVGMFYATTASGSKWLDPILFLMNPFITCKFKILERLPGYSTCVSEGKSKFKVANEVQERIGKALNFECTDLTRKDKYMFLAGNQGIV